MQACKCPSLAHEEPCRGCMGCRRGYRGVAGGCRVAGVAGCKCPVTGRVAGLQPKSCHICANRARGRLEFRFYGRGTGAQRTSGRAPARPIFTIRATAGARCRICGRRSRSHSRASRTIGRSRRTRATFGVSRSPTRPSSPVRSRIRADAPPRQKPSGGGAHRARHTHDARLLHAQARPMAASAHGTSARRTGCARP